MPFCPGTKTEHLYIGLLRRLLRFYSSNINQHDGDIVLDRIHAAALNAFQATSILFQNDRFLADGTDKHVEQILGNHSFQLYRRFHSSGGRLRPP